MNYLQNLFNHKNPTIPDNNEATRIINLALLIISLSPNASNVIKIDIVNPIPPKNAIVQGFGNVGSAAAFYLAQMGAKVVGIIDRDGGIMKDEGYDRA